MMTRKEAEVCLLLSEKKFKFKILQEVRPNHCIDLNGAFHLPIEKPPKTVELGATVVESLWKGVTSCKRLRTIGLYSILLII